MIHAQTKPQLIYVSNKLKRKQKEDKIHYIKIGYKK